jgi:hypothetical protein
LLSAVAAASAMRDLDEWMRPRFFARKQRKGGGVELALRRLDQSRLSPMAAPEGTSEQRFLTASRSRAAFRAAVILKSALAAC